MRKKIPVEKLSLGMYLTGMDKAWFNTPFLRHHFLIKKENQIEKIIDSGISHVYIDTSKGLDISKKDMIVKSDNESLLKKDFQPDFSKASEEDLSACDQQKENYLKVDKNIFLKGSFIDFSLFIKNRLIINNLIRFNNKDIEIDENILNSNGEFLIDKEDIQKYKNYLKGILNQNSTLSQQSNKNIIIREMTKTNMKELFDNPRSGEKIKECKTAVENIVEAILSSNGLISELLVLDKIDYYIYTHSVNVCVYTLSASILVGIDRESELFSIGLGSLLHDIGKSTIPPEILNRPEKRLTNMEYNIIKQHVLEGENLLKLYDDIPGDAFYPLLEHHERLSGKGYPYGLKGNDIHLSGKIIAIANLYDTITTSGPYRKAMASFDALSFIRNKSEDYDTEIFREFVKMISKIK